MPSVNIKFLSKLYPLCPIKITLYGIQVLSKQRGEVSVSEIVADSLVLRMPRAFMHLGGIEDSY